MVSKLQGKTKKQLCLPQLKLLLLPPPCDPEPLVDESINSGLTLKKLQPQPVLLPDPSWVVLSQELEEVDKLCEIYWLVYPKTMLEDYYLEISVLRIRRGKVFNAPNFNSKSNM